MTSDDGTLAGGGGSRGRGDGSQAIAGPDAGGPACDGGGSRAQSDGSRDITAPDAGGPADRGGPPAAMPDTPAPSLERSAAVRDHLANERTLLAWQRTALALVGLGFVVDRFAFEGASEKALLGTLLGLAMIAGGAAAAVAGVWRFRTVERQIDDDDYQPSIMVHLVFAAGIVAVAVLLVVYLLLAKP